MKKFSSFQGTSKKQIPSILFSVNCNFKYTIVATITIIQEKCKEQRYANFFHAQSNVN